VQESRRRAGLRRFRDRGLSPPCSLRQRV